MAHNVTESCDQPDRIPVHFNHDDTTHIHFSTIATPLTAKRAVVRLELRN